LNVLNQQVEDERVVQPIDAFSGHVGEFVISETECSARDIFKFIDPPSPSTLGGIAVCPHPPPTMDRSEGRKPQKQDVVDEAEYARYVSLGLRALDVQSHFVFSIEHYVRRCISYHRIAVDLDQLPILAHKEVKMKISPSERFASVFRLSGPDGDLSLQRAIEASMQYVPEDPASIRRAQGRGQEVFDLTEDEMMAM
jgi:hypothetical protein